MALNSHILKPGEYVTDQFEKLLWRIVRVNFEEVYITLVVQLVGSFDNRYRENVRLQGIMYFYIRPLGKGRWQLGPYGRELKIVPKLKAILYDRTND